MTSLGLLVNKHFDPKPICLFVSISKMIIYCKTCTTYPVQPLERAGKVSINHDFVAHHGFNHAKNSRSRHWCYWKSKEGRTCIDSVKLRLSWQHDRVQNVSLRNNISRINHSENKLYKGPCKWTISPKTSSEKLCRATFFGLFSFGSGFTISHI